MKSSNRGFVLVTTLMILSLAMVLIAFLINRSTVFFPLVQTCIDREKAKELALGGLQLASSQIAYADVIEEKESGNKNNEKKATDNNNALAQSKQLLKTLIPILNKWQTIKLDTTKDGIDGEIRICITSEDGKININELYDFQKHEFIKGKEQEEFKKLLQELFGKLKKSSDSEDPLMSVEAFLKERTDSLRDVSELISAKAFAGFKNNIFFNPDQQNSQSKDKKTLYLSDIFTIWSRKRTIDPWLMSYSIRSMLELAELSKGPYVEAIKNFKGTYNWPTDWNNIFSKLYKKDFNNLPKGMQHLLNVNFGPETFSVLSYGTVGQVTHRLYAIIERDTINRIPKEPAKISIRKLYWV